MIPYGVMSCRPVGSRRLERQSSMPLRARVQAPAFSSWRSALPSLRADPSQHGRTGMTRSPSRRGTYLLGTESTAPPTTPRLESKAIAAPSLPGEPNRAGAAAPRQALRNRRSDTRMCGARSPWKWHRPSFFPSTAPSATFPELAGNERRSADGALSEEPFAPSEGLLSQRIARTVCLFLTSATHYTSPSPR